MEGEKLKVVLPCHLRNRSITERVIPKAYSLKTVLNHLLEVKGDLSALKPWEKSCYRAYELSEIQDLLLESYKEEWPCLIKEHLLQKEPTDLGANAVDIYLTAYVTETYGTGLDQFSKGIKEMGITTKENTVRSIWKVGKGDGQYLGLLNADGTILDINFFRQWAENDFLS